MTISKELHDRLDQRNAAGLKLIAKLLDRPIEEVQATHKLIRQGNNPELTDEEIDAEATRIAHLLNPQEQQP
jgi:hypothetical protein